METMESIKRTNNWTHGLAFPYFHSIDVDNLRSTYIFNFFVEPLSDIFPVAGEIGSADGATMLIRGFDVFDETFEDLADSLRPRMLLSFWKGEVKLKTQLESDNSGL